MVSEIRKYPRTSHIRGSRLQHGDHDLEAVPWEELAGKHLVVEEKMDGSNCGVSFDDDGTLLLQSRGHYLRGGPREKQFALLKQWASSRQEEFFCALGTRYVMYGEWLFAKHTCFYDALPHYFMEFDVLDTETGGFLDTPARGVLLAGCGVVPVKVLWAGRFDRLEALKSMIVRSYFVSSQREDWTRHLTDAASDAGVLPVDAVKHTDQVERMEGLYLKWEEDGLVKGRYKFVRDTFTSAVLDQEQHWHDRPIVQNGLVSGAFEAMFS